MITTNSDDDGSDEEQLVDDPFYGFEDPPHHAPPPTANLRRSKRIQIQKEKLRPLRVDQANRATKGATLPPPKILGKQALSLHEALSSEDGELWRTAVEDEYDSLMKKVEQFAEQEPAAPEAAAVASAPPPRRVHALFES